MCENYDDAFLDGMGEEEYEAYMHNKMFADPGGRSALRAASPSNPRIYPCPTCGTENVLTAADVAQGYQCDGCADAAEGIGGY